jgi:hypothetical protein
MIANIPSDIIIVPLEDVDITVGPKELVKKRGEEYYLENYSRNSSSDASGNVDNSWTIVAGKAQYLVKASKIGIREFVGEVEHVQAISFHAMIAILVRDNN